MPANVASPAVPPTKPLWQKRIPTFLGLGFLVIALVIGVIFMGQGGGVFAPRATAETTPKNVRLTNVTDTTFTVSFLTEDATIGFVKYGTEENKVNLRSADDRDQLSGTEASYTMHHITVRNLQPGTPYFYVIGSNGAQFDNNGAIFRVTTAKRSGTPTAAKTIYGSVTNESGSPAGGAVVYIKIDGAGDLSALVTNTGGWAVPLSNARTPDGSGYAVIGDTTAINISVQGAQSTQTAQGTVTVAEAQPVPTIAFGRGLAQAEASATPVPTPTPTLTPTPTPTATPTPTPSPSATPDLTASTASASSATSSLLSDSTASGAASASGSAEVGGPEVTIVDVQSTVKPTVTTTQPVITGTAAANVTVTIQVNSETQITQQVTSDGTGAFELDLSTLQANLEPGEHTVTISYVDPVTGQNVTTTRTFTVAPRAQLAQATPTPTPFGSSNPFPIGGATTSATATGSATPTPTPTTSASGSATATRSSVPSTSSGVPVSGAVGTTLALIFGGLFFIIAGSWSYWISSQFAKEETTA